MKKSFLWTAAGIVSAAALWAAISLPQHSRVRSHAHPTDLVRSVVVSVEDPYDGLSMSVPLTTEPYTVEWNGRMATVRSKSTKTAIGSSAGALRPTTLTITRTTLEQGQGFSRSSRQSITRTFQPGETLSLQQ